MSIISCSVLKPSAKAWLCLLYILQLGSNKISHSLSLCSAAFLRVTSHVLQPPLGGPLLNSPCYVSGFSVMANPKLSQGWEIKGKALAGTTQYAVGFFAVKADCSFTFGSAHQGLPGLQSFILASQCWPLPLHGLCCICCNLSSLIENDLTITPASCWSILRC